MNYESLSSFLEKQGLHVERGLVSELVSTPNGGVLQCVDGREPKEHLPDGPKFPGGIEGIAWFFAKGRGSQMIEAVDVSHAIDAVVKNGFVPGVHDMHENPHCGHAKKVMENAFPVGMGISPDQIAEMVAAAGGVNSHMQGQHGETRVNLNLRSGTTRSPQQADQAFQVDVWFAEQLGLNPQDVIAHSAATVKMLLPSALNTIRVYE